jgi:hypothetical protein
MSESKKDNLFAKLASQQSRALVHEESAAPVTGPADTAPSPAPVEAKQKPSPAKKKPEPVKGKRDNPNYCQANAYVPKSLRRAVDKALFDVEGLDYSSLIEDLLKKWLKSRGVSE